MGLSSVSLSVMSLDWFAAFPGVVLRGDMELVKVVPDLSPAATLRVLCYGPPLWGAGPRAGGGHDAFTLVLTTG